MTSRERVLTAFARQEPDRVPVDFAANAAIKRRLQDHFALAADDHDGLLEALGVDFRGVHAAYTGPKLHADIPERGIKVDDWGMHRRWVEHESGGYWDYCEFPLQNADEEAVANWALPSPDDYDFSHIPELCKQYEGYAIGAGGPGVGDVINSNGFLRGMEQVLVDLMADDPAGKLLTDRRTGVWLELMRRTIEASKGAVTHFYMGEDLGTQRGPTISPELYRKQIKPVHKRFVDMAKSFDLPVMIHSCGSSSWAFDDFIDLGIDVVDTLQPEAANMDPAYLKQTFGDRLAFHGCISTAGPVAYGSVDDVRTDCRAKLETMMPGGGYCFAPTHSLQDNSPTENVLAMYETARKRGVYGEEAVA